MKLVLHSFACSLEDYFLKSIYVCSYLNPMLFLSEEVISIHLNIFVNDISNGM